MRTTWMMCSKRSSARWLRRSARHTDGPTFQGSSVERLCGTIEAISKGEAESQRSGCPEFGLRSRREEGGGGDRKGAHRKISQPPHSRQRRSAERYLLIAGVGWRAARLTIGRCVVVRTALLRPVLGARWCLAHHACHYGIGMGCPSRTKAWAHLQKLQFVWVSELGGRALGLRV